MCPRGSLRGGVGMCRLFRGRFSEIRPRKWVLNAEQSFRLRFSVGEIEDMWFNVVYIASDLSILMQEHV